MKHRLSSVSLSGTALLAVLFSPALRSAPAPVTTAPSVDQVVQLSPFTVQGDEIGRYEATESASGSRVATSLMDSAQHVSVVTNELMQDIGMGRAFDGAKYIAGVDEATIPNAQDRTNIRGFQIDGVTVDGFSYFSFGQIDPVLIDRIEVVKGPNAILAPTGQPGGTENIVSKQPIFTDQGYISGQAGLWSAQRVEFDDNVVLSPNKVAVRVVGAYQDTDDYPGNGNFHRSTTLMPMLAYQFGPSSKLSVQVQADDYRSTLYLGVPISPNDGTNSPLTLYPGISKTLDLYDKNDTARYQKDVHGRALFTTNITDNLSTRVATDWITSHAFTKQTNLSGQSNVVIDPNTGNSVLSATPAAITGVFSRSYGNDQQDRIYLDLQNDYVYNVKGDTWSSSTVAGFWLHQDRVYDMTFNATKPNFNIYNYVTAPPTYVFTNGTDINGELYTVSRTVEEYVSESLGLFSDHLILSGGEALAAYQVHVNDRFRNLNAANNPSVREPTYGAVLKPIKEIALYYGHSEQGTPIAPSTTSVIPETIQSSRQNEYGIRFQPANGRLYAQISYFDIKQNNYSVPNPANLVVPTPNPPFPPLFMNRKAYGMEYEVSAAITPEISLIGNYTSYKNRNPFGQVFRGVAEQSGALWASYTFKKSGSLKGLVIGAGLDYEAKRPGDAPSATPTSASTPTNIIEPQPSFYLPARTLVNAEISYAFDRHWQAQLNVDNLLNRTYYEASINRYMVYPGVPINPRLTVRYRF